MLINGVPLGKDFENLDRYVCASSGATGRWVGKKKDASVGMYWGRSSYIAIVGALHLSRPFLKA